MHVLRLAVALSLILVSGIVGTAAAARIATPREKAGIAAGVRGYMKTSGCCATARAKLILYRVSSLDPDFATVTIHAVRPGGLDGPSAIAVLVHTYSGQWATIAFGTARLACGVQPRVRRDLGLPPCR